MITLLSLYCSAVMGINFACASENHLPPMYMFGRKEQTFNGHLKGACYGKECLNSPNYFLNYIKN